MNISECTYDIMMHKTGLKNYVLTEYCQDRFDKIHYYQIPESLQQMAFDIDREADSVVREKMIQAWWHSFELHRHVSRTDRVDSFIRTDYSEKFNEKRY